MFYKILTWISGGVIGQIGKQLNQAYATKLEAKNEKDRIAAEVTISTLEARRTVLVAESRSRWNIMFRAFLALPFGIFVWKVIVYDKIMKMGATDPLSSDLWNLMMVVYGFYFVYETASLFKKSK